MHDLVVPHVKGIRVRDFGSWLPDLGLSSPTPNIMII